MESRVPVPGIPVSFGRHAKLVAAAMAGLLGSANRPSNPLGFPWPSLRRPGRAGRNSTTPSESTLPKAGV